MSTAPPIVTRPEWGADAPEADLTPWSVGQPDHTTGHWEGVDGPESHAECFQMVRSIQDFHQRGEFIDIAYNWLICPHGVLFEGRGRHFRGAAQNAGNRSGESWCFLGGPRTPFTDAAKRAAHWLAGGRPCMRHKDEPGNSTSCPGPVDPMDTDSPGAWILAGCPDPGGSHTAPQPAPPLRPLPSAGVRHPTLRLASRGPAVLELQRKLNGVAGTRLAQDGIFGAKTDRAVRNFQAFFKLGVDGIVGPKTWGMLDYCAAIRGIR
jgi:hypothetical protein